jgi:TRAP-type C4-dicarboxylate transport system substrate-binding protein
MRKIVFLFLSLVVVTTLVFAGCTQEAPAPAPAPTPAPAPAPAPAPTPAPAPAPAPAPTPAPAPAPAPAKPVMLQLESFTPVGTPPNKIFHYIFEGLDEATDGLVTTRYHEAGVMGAPSETLERVLAGVVDVGVLVAGYFPGVFNMTEVFELPIHYPDATYGATAWSEMYKKGYFDEEMSIIKPITCYMIGPYNVLSRDPVRSVEDFDGMKMRGPTDMFRRIDDRLGAIAVQLAGPELYTAMSKGIIDATWACWEMSFAFKLKEPTKYILSTDLSTSSHILAMNHDSWANLPDVAKAYLDDNFYSHMLDCGPFWQGTNAHFHEDLLSDPEIENIIWSEAEFAKLDALLAPIIEEWIAEREAQGHPAKQAVQDLYDILVNAGVKAPFAKLQ